MSRELCKKTFISAFLVLILGISPAMASGDDAVTLKSGDYSCWSLGAALEDLRVRYGLKLLWSSDVVRDEMQVKKPVEPSTPREMLEQILSPFGLKASTVKGGEILLIVPAGPGKRGAAAPVTTRGTVERLLPDWLDAETQPAAWVFPVAAAPELGDSDRSLIVRIESEALAKTFGADLAAAAFRLKEGLVALAAEKPGLRVALEGPPLTLEALVREGLAPYVHAYIYESQKWLPSSDPSARGWQRSSVQQGPAILDALLAAASRGDQLVIFQRAQIDPLHHAFLRYVQGIDAANLSEQPPISGVESGHARFFFDPASGDRYLAVYAQEDSHRIEFRMPLFRDVQRLFPAALSAPEMDLTRSGDAVAFRLPGDSPYQLFLLRAAGGQPHRDLDVASNPLFDPYELVVANQIFQQRQLESFRSLDVMEYLSVTPQYLGGDQITWEHRILQRQGKLTEYHHLGFWRNGSRYPENKLLMGRLYRNEALVQLHPLEIELDETYRYSYLGLETVDGHPSHHIRFEPARQGSREDGTLVRGEVWLDETSNAHRRVRTYQEGLDGQLVYQDRVYHYEWIAQAGECFWDWRHRDGSYVLTSLGKPYAVRTATRREDFKYNRPDIDIVARAAYEDDVMIHVEMPPKGHRWLVKLEGERRLARRPDDWQHYPQEGMVRSEAAEVPPALPSHGGESTEDPYAFLGNRVLADVGSFSSRVAFTVGGFGSGSGQSVDLFPGIVLTDQDLFGRGLFGYVGLFKDEMQAAISFPSLFGGKAALTGFVDLPYDQESNYQIRTEKPPTAGEPSEFDIDVYSPSLTLALAVPLHRSLTLDLSYTLRSLSFDPVAGREFANFLIPDDTDEHVLDVELGWRWRGLHLAAGLEVGHRTDWSRWGLDGSEPANSTYQMLRLRGFSSRALRNDHTIGAGFGYFKGFDLDRFSRLPAGRARATVVGFSTTVGYDEAAFGSVQYGASLWRRLPINLRVEVGVSRFEDASWEQRVGTSFRFLINGPFKTDLWPSVRYTLHSSVPGEEGDMTYGLVMRRRY